MSAQCTALSYISSAESIVDRQLSSIDLHTSIPAGCAKRRQLAEDFRCILPWGEQGVP